MAYLKSKISLFLFFSVILAGFAQDTSFPGHSHNDYVHNDPLAGALTLGYRSVEIDLYCRKNELVVSHLPFCLSKKPRIEDIYFGEQLDSLLDHHLVGQERLVYLIDFKHKPGKLLQLLRSVVLRHKELIYDSCINPEGKIQIVLTGKIPLKYLTSEDYCFIDIDGRLHKQYTAEQRENIYMYSFSYSGALNKYKVDLYPVLSRISQGMALNNKTIRLWGTPNRPDIWRKMLDANVGIIHVDKLAEFKAFYEAWRRSHL